MTAMPEYNSCLFLIERDVSLMNVFVTRGRILTHQPFNDVAFDQGLRDYFRNVLFGYMLVKDIFRPNNHYRPVFTKTTTAGLLDDDVLIGFLDSNLVFKGFPHMLAPTRQAACPTTDNYGLCVGLLLSKDRFLETL